MSWQCTIEQQDKQQHIRLNSTSALPLSIYSSHACQVAETDTAIAVVIGRVRPYNNDYLKQDTAKWLLDCYQQHTDTLTSHIAGFFLLIIANKKDGSLSIINDHVGSIPCYLDQRDATALCISDNLPATIARSSGQLNPQAIYNYLFFHCIPSPHSIYTGITKLEPGVITSINRTGSLTLHHYYQPEFTASNLPEEHLMAQCRQLISEAVRRNSSDNCAAFLSGGLDSSTVAGMLAEYSTEHNRIAKTYSIGFKAKGYDETEYAQLSAKHFATEHKVHYLQPDEIARHFTEVAGYFNEPFGNSSAMAAYICAKVAKADGISVMLAGDGGDEIFAGNERYVKQKVFEHYNALPDMLQALLNIAFDNNVADSIPVLKKASSYVRQANVPLPDRLDSYNFLNRFNLQQMFNPAFLQQVDAALPAQQKRQRYQSCKSADVVDKLMYLDWKFTAADNDFVKVSQMCQLAGIEVRFPLFEKELVDFSCTIPATLKAPAQQLRKFYKDSFRGFLHDATLTKSKHGFGLPFGVWMKQRPDLQKIAFDALQSVKKRNILQSDFIDHATDTFVNGHAGYYGELVWIIVVLELWLQQHEVGYVA